MCDYIKYGKLEIDTIAELKQTFGLKEVVIDAYYKNEEYPGDYTCLCWVDISKTLRKAKIKYRDTKCGWWEVKDE